MEPFDIERAEAPCGLLDDASQVLVGRDVRVVERAPTDAQRSIALELAEAGGVVHARVFDFEGALESAHRAAAIGIVRRALATEWAPEDAAAMRVFPRAERSAGALPAPWPGALRIAVMEPPYRLSPAPRIGFFEAWLDAWLGPAAYERLAAHPPAIDVRAHGPEVCPTFFAAGLEWWGAYLLTFRSGDASTIVALTASSTD